MGLLALGRTHWVIGWIAWRGPQCLRTVALIVALISFGGAFFFAAREARAQEQHAAVNQQSVAIDVEVAEPVETAPTNASLVDSPQVGRHESGARPGSPTTRDATPLAPKPVPEPASEPPGDPEPAPGVDPTRTPEPMPKPQTAPALDREPLLDQAPASEPVVSQENEPLLSESNEAPALEPAVPDREGLYPLSSSEALASSTEEPLQSPAYTSENPADQSYLWSAAEDESQIGPPLVDIFTGGEAGHAPVSEHAEDPMSSGSSGAEGPSKGAPQPSSPLAPVGSSSFSLLSGSGQMGTGGAFAPLLLCVLVSGLILLRRDGRLSRVICEPPKPSSALLLPLERPG